MRNAGLEEAQAGIKTAGRNINNLRYADDTNLMAESKEELKSLLMKVTEESEKAGLKPNIQKTKIMASSPITSWQIDGETMETVTDFIFLGSKITVGFPSSSAGKESTCNAGDPGSIPGSGRFTGEGISYPLQYSWVSLVAQLVKNPPEMQESWVLPLGWQDPLEKGTATHSSNLAWRIPWTV